MKKEIVFTNGLTILFIFASITVGLGCQSKPDFEISPEALSFGDKANEKNIVLTPIGGKTPAWFAVEVTRKDEKDKNWKECDVSWLSIKPTAGIVSGSTIVTVKVTRKGLEPGEYANAGIKFISGLSSQVVPVAMTVRKALTVTPNVVKIQFGEKETILTVNNSGIEPLDWQVEYVADLSKPEETGEIPSSLTVTPSSGTISANGKIPVVVRWGEFRERDFGLLFRSSFGEQLIEFRFIRECAAEVIESAPKEVIVIVTTESINTGNTTGLPFSKVTITNKSSTNQDWSAKIRDAGGAEVDVIAITPSSGTLKPSESTIISMAVKKPKEIQLGANKYNLVVDLENCFLNVPIRVEQLSLPQIAISEPPQTANTRPEVIPIEVLDFGQEEVQKEFWIVNVGPRDSRLYFRISHEDQGKENPIIADIRPSTGGANGEDGNAEDFFHPQLQNVLIDGVKIVVTINRDNLENDVEYREITIEAVDRDPVLFPNEAVLLTGVEPKKIKIRVQRQPMRVEGALNRSRPPYVMRFVFMLRDSSGRVIPTITEADRAKLRLTISEDGRSLDLNETMYYLSGPQNLKGNIVILLDYTGSMYYAGVGDKENPLRPGEALEKVKKAVIDFIYDLPDSYQIALMFHNDRQARNRLIRGFTTNKEELRNALEWYSIPPNLMGATDIYDALGEAVDRLVAEDAKHALPFDDADMKAVIFITDGWDTSSSVELNAIQSRAKDSRIRLYPVGFASGGSVNVADLVNLSKETGGHLYIAKNVSELTSLFGNQKSMVLRNGIDASQPAEKKFYVFNEGKQDIAYQIDITRVPRWIKSVSPAQGVISPGNKVEIKIQTDASVVTDNLLVSAELPISSNDGSGKVILEGLAEAGVWKKLDMRLEDEPGRIWNEFLNQLVLTYITPKQKDFKYTIRFEYNPGDNKPVLTSIFEENAFAYIGDIRAGQISMVSSGLYWGLHPSTKDRMTWQAEVFVRADYVPRDVYFLRTRYFLQKPEMVSDAQWALLLEDVDMKVEPAENGLLSQGDMGWRFIDEGDGKYLILNSEDNPFMYGAFGNLFKITLTGLDRYVQSFATPDSAILYLAMRVDNEALVSPQTATSISRTKYFLYPGGPTYLDGVLVLTTSTMVAGPSTTIMGLSGLPFDPEATGVWDSDKDGLPDFQDPYPNDKLKPGSLVIPNSLNIVTGVNTASFVIRNNRLDTFRWEIVNYPNWVISIRYGDNGDSLTPKSVLSPGEEEKVTLTVNRTGLTPGTKEFGVLSISTDAYGIIPVNLGLEVK